jgi:hypothetical protein
MDREVVRGPKLVSAGGLEHRERAVKRLGDYRHRWGCTAIPSRCWMIESVKPPHRAALRLTIERNDLKRI